MDTVHSLLRMRASLNNQQSDQQLITEVDAALEQVIETVNQFFYEKLIAMEGIRGHMEEID